jgi:hypothetical protein
VGHQHEGRRAVAPERLERVEHDASGHPVEVAGGLVGK